MKSNTFIILCIVFLMFIGFSNAPVFPNQESNDYIYYSGGEITFTPAGGSFSGKVKIQLEVQSLKSNTGIDIPTETCYTVNGDTPTRDSMKLAKDRTITLSGVGLHIVKARTFGKVGKYAGKIYDAEYVIQSQAPQIPVIDPTPETVNPPPVTDPVRIDPPTAFGGKGTSGRQSLTCTVYKALLSSSELQGFPVVVEKIDGDTIALRGVSKSSFYSAGDDPVDNYWENENYEDKVAVVTDAIERVTGKKVQWFTYTEKDINGVTLVMNDRKNEACGK